MNHLYRCDTHLAGRKRRGAQIQRLQKQVRLIVTTFLKIPKAPTAESLRLRLQFPAGLDNGRRLLVVLALLFCEHQLAERQFVFRQLISKAPCRNELEQALPLAWIGHQQSTARTQLRFLRSIRLHRFVS